MIFKTRCYSGGAKHNFSPRFDRKSEPTRAGRVTGFYDEGELEALFNTVTTTYIYDVCTWCGKIIKR
jgi:hypothetical protein